ncbi:MAG: rseP [Clostridia bacterium]|nr:rseP [Clostridia bacterium]
MLTFITAIIVFTALVVIHEFGHFIFARMAGIKVEEFAVGMGPKIWGYQGKETLYSIRAFPLGGFCKMLGEDESNQDPRAFNNKPVWRRLLVIVFGPIMNLVLAILIFSLTFAPITVIKQVIETAPAGRAGIVAGERIVEIQGSTVTEWDQIKPLVNQNAGKQTSVKLEKNGVIREVILTPETQEGTEGAVIGVVPSYGYQGFSIGNGLKTATTVSYQMIDYLGKLFVGKASTEEVVGPVGIIYYMSDAAKTGLLAVLSLTAFLSLNLFIVNLLPLPALDGGRLIFLIIEGIRRKPVDPQKEGFVHFVGFVLLMILSALIIYRDFIKFDVFKF